MKKFLNHPAVKGTLLLCLLIGLIHIVSALTLDRTLEYKELRYQSGKITDALHGYKIVFLTDIHGYPEADLRTMVDNINAHGVDLVLLGGDYSGQKDLSLCFEILAEIQAADGIFGIEGNHDNAGRLRTAMQTQGMTMLENSGVTVRENLYLAGLVDLWNRTPDVPVALSGASGEDFVLMLAHNPDTSVVHDFTGVDLAFSGHVHGGEVTFFGLWAPAMPLVSAYGQRFRSGWCRSDADTDVYVSNGIGTHALRVFARPQVIYLTLESDNQ